MIPKQQTTNEKPNNNGDDRDQSLPSIAPIGDQPCFVLTGPLLRWWVDKSRHRPYRAFRDPTGNNHVVGCLVQEAACIEEFPPLLTILHHLGVCAVPVIN
jgi:hypothetical protein